MLRGLNINLRPLVSLTSSFGVLQFVIVSLTGWGLLIYGSYKFFTGGKKDKQEEVLNHCYMFMILFIVLIRSFNIMVY